MCLCLLEWRKSTSVCVSSWQEDKSVGATKWNRGWSNCTLCGNVIGRASSVNQMLEWATEAGARHTHANTSARERRRTHKSCPSAQAAFLLPITRRFGDVHFVCADLKDTLIANSMAWAHCQLHTSFSQQIQHAVCFLRTVAFVSTHSETHTHTHSYISHLLTWDTDIA